MNKNKKGFTIIELLVVVGMIAILGTVVMVVLNPKEKIDKGGNGVIQSKMAVMALDSRLMLSTEDSLTGFCDEKASLIESVEKYASIERECEDEKYNFVFSVKSKDSANTLFCVDAILEDGFEGKSAHLSDLKCN